MQVGQQFGMTPTEAAAVAANLNTSDPMGALIDNINPAEVNTGPRVDFNDSERAAIVQSATEMAAASGKTPEQALYDYAVSQGYTNDQVDAAMGFPPGSTAAFAANEAAASKAAETSQAKIAEDAMAKAMAAVNAAGGRVSQSDAIAIANNTNDPVAALAAISGWTGGSSGVGNSSYSGGAVTDSSGRSVTDSSGSSVTWGG
jgi:hypothetical protein